MASAMALHERVLRLGRLHMTQFSAITYLCASLAAGGAVDLSRLLTGYVFVFSCQMVAHYLGEYFDARSDQLNAQSSPLTGGSGSLRSGNRFDASICLAMGAFFAAVSTALIVYVLPGRVATVATMMLAIAHQYSAPPFLLNHRCLGELAAAVVQNVLLPYFAACNQSALFAAAFPYDHRLAHIVWPSFFVKVALFILLNLNDRRADWLGDKVTLAVRLGDRQVLLVHHACIVLAYLSAAVLPMPGLVRVGMMCTAIPAIRLVVSLAKSGPLWRYDETLGRSLVHCVSMVWVILAYSVVVERAVIDVPAIIVMFGAFMSRRGLIGAFKASRIIPHQLVSEDVADAPILICGAGIAGLVAALTLAKQSIPFIIIEKRSSFDTSNGADLALWPSSVRILRLLGIGDSFWNKYTHPVTNVHMRKLGSRQVLHKISMSKVVNGAAEHFRMVSRQHLMSALLALVPAECIRFNTSFQSIRNGESTPIGALVNVYVRQQGAFFSTAMPVRLIIGADGISSSTRSSIYNKLSEEDDVRYCGEVCYRGLIDLASGCATEVSDAIYDLTSGLSAGTIAIDYGPGIRSAVGFLDYPANQFAYWWIKHASASGNCARGSIRGLPSGLQSLIDHTPEDSLYIHKIVDRRTNGNRWSNQHTVLIGDAAHPMTPNMGQGAGLAVEDAFVLCTSLGQTRDYIDGAVESFYQYERRRRSYIDGVSRSSYFQSKIGQWSHPALIWIREHIIYHLPAFVFIRKLRGNLFDISPELSYHKKL